MDWSAETFSIGELRDLGTLPLVVKIECQDRVQSNADLDLYQPLLLYKAYKGIKVQARLLFRQRSEPAKDGFQTLGNISLVIPKGYSGESSAGISQRNLTHKKNYN